MSKLDDDYEVEGIGQEELSLNIKDMDERTYTISVNAPEELSISAVIEKHKNTESPRFVILTSQTMVPGTLFPQTTEDILHNKKYKNIGFIPSNSQTMKVLREYIPDIEQNGFFLVVREERKATIIPSKGFLATLCRRLYTGAIQPGINVFAFCYLSTLLKNAGPFQIIARKESVSSTCYKGFHCASINFTMIPQAIVWNLKKLLEKEAKVEVWKWKMTNFVTKVNFIFPEYSIKLKNDIFSFGIRYQMSTIGDCSLTLQPIIKCHSSVFTYGKNTTISHRAKDTKINKMLPEMVKNSMKYIPVMKTEIMRFLELSNQKMNDNPDIILKKLLKLADVNIGKKRIERLVSMCPEDLETLYDLLIWIVQAMDNYPEKLPEYVQNSFEEGMGRIFTLNAKTLGGFLECL